MTSLKWPTGSREISGTSRLTGLLCHWHLVVLYVAIKQHCTKRCNIESIYTAWRMQKDMDTFQRHRPLLWNPSVTGWVPSEMPCWANSWFAGDLRRHGAHAASLPTLATQAWITLQIVITMTSWWARWRLKSPASRLFIQSFIQTQIKENIKAPRHWPLCGEFTGDRWIPHTNGQ